MAPEIAPSPDQLSTEKRELVRERSKALFGNRDRIDVAVAIALGEDAAVNATDLAAEIGLANSRVRAQLLAFADAGLLSRVEPGGELKRWYRRENNPFWQSCLALYLEWIR